jgi:CheY-like chemotaxis protein
MAGAARRVLEPGQTSERNLSFDRGSKAMQNAAASSLDRSFQSVLYQPPAPHVIVADDDLAVRVVIAKVLEREGYSVETCVDGADLLESIAPIARARVRGETARLDLVFSDVRMPRLSGFEVLEALEQQGWFVPFVLMTGISEPATACPSGLHAAGFLQKPLRRAALLAVVDALAPFDA